MKTIGEIVVVGILGVSPISAVISIYIHIGGSKGIYDGMYIHSSFMSQGVMLFSSSKLGKSARPDPPAVFKLSAESSHRPPQKKIPFVLRIANLALPNQQHTPPKWHP